MHAVFGPRLDCIRSTAPEILTNLIQLSADKIKRKFMGRPLEFTRDDVIAHAVDAFWQEGYAHLSAGKLADAMGLAKSSLYNTFESKHTVLLQAITRYADVKTMEVRSLIDCDDVAEALRSLLCDMVKDSGRGCFMVNAAAELGGRDPEVRALLNAGFGRMQQAFAAVIVAGQQRGTISLTVDAQAHALALMASIAGIRILAKSGFGESQLASITSMLVDGLKK
jgi:TetR/AcrR family transcriptional repressor of nem operon